MANDAQNIYTFNTNVFQVWKRNIFTLKFNFSFKKITYISGVNAGFPNPTPPVEVCNAGGSDGKIRVDTSILLQSQNYPKYPTTPTKCTKEIITSPGKGLRVYLIDAGFQSTIGAKFVLLLIYFYQNDTILNHIFSQLQ